MSHWDSKLGQIVRWPTATCEDYPGWQHIDCGCCAGLRWGGETPEECDHCAGSGRIWHHIKSGVLAEWPGGPFLGRLSLNEMLGDENG